MPDARVLLDPPPVLQSFVIHFGSGSGGFSFGGSSTDTSTSSFSFTL